MDTPKQINPENHTMLQNPHHSDCSPALLLPTKHIVVLLSLKPCLVNTNEHKNMDFSFSFCNGEFKFFSQVKETKLPLFCIGKFCIPTSE